MRNERYMHANHASRLVTTYIPAFGSAAAAAAAVVAVVLFCRLLWLRRYVLSNKDLLHRASQTRKA